MNKALDNYACTGQLGFDSLESFDAYIKLYQENVPADDNSQQEAVYADNRN